MQGIPDFAFWNIAAVQILLGEFQEDESSLPNIRPYASNDIFSATNTGEVRSQYLGNLLSTDRATISVGGTIASAADVDFYRFDLNYATVNGSSASVVFDLDYADGMNRADTSLAVFQSSGGNLQLIYFAEDSNIADDRGPRVLPADWAHGSCCSADGG